MSEEAFCVQMVGQLGCVLELIGWFQAVIVVTATTSFIPDFVSDIIYSPLSPCWGLTWLPRFTSLAPLSVERVVPHGMGQLPASGGQEWRTTPPVEASVRPVAPRVHQESTPCTGMVSYTIIEHDRGWHLFFGLYPIMQFSVAWISAAIWKGIFYHLWIFHAANPMNFSWTFPCFTMLQICMSIGSPSDSRRSLICITLQRNLLFPWALFDMLSTSSQQ